MCDILTNSPTPRPGLVINCADVRNCAQKNQQNNTCLLDLTNSTIPRPGLVINCADVRNCGKKPQNNTCLLDLTNSTIPRPGLVINCADVRNCGKKPQNNTCNQTSTSTITPRPGLVINCADVNKRSQCQSTPIPPTINNVKIRGYLIDATNNNKIQDDKLSNAELIYTNIDSNQTYNAAILNGSIYEVNLPVGNYVEKCNVAKFANLTTNVTLNESLDETTNSTNIFLSPQLSGWRVILTWNRVEKDLDAHIIIPNGMDIGFNNRKSYDGKVTLDVDARQGNGPETITLVDPADGVYKYYVFRYSKELPLAQSGVKVVVFQGNQQIKEYTVPGDAGVDANYWFVGEIDVANGTFNEVNQIKQPKLLRI